MGIKFISKACRQLVGDEMKFDYILNNYELQKAVNYYLSHHGFMPVGPTEWLNIGKDDFKVVVPVRVEGDNTEGKNV